MGWQVEFGDWQGFLSGTNRLIQRFEQQPKKLATQLQGLSNEVRKSYSFQAMIQSVAEGLTSLGIAIAELMFSPTTHALNLNSRLDFFNRLVQMSLKLST